MAKDYYSVLGVSKNATKVEISAAYKKLAKKFHPDLNREAGAADKFKEISEAYEVLNDDNKRSNFDNFGSAEGQGHGGFGGFGGGSGGFEGFNNDDLGDIFGEMFGFKKSGSRTQSREGEDIQIILTLKLEDSFFGLENKSFSVKTHVKCNDCHGKGGTGEVSRCRDCGGSGMKASSHGFISFSSTCRSCGGAGQKMLNVCKKCHGEGRLSENKTIKINIPQGVEEGMVLKYKGLGEAGLRGGANGDLLINIKIKNHPTFQRKGMDLFIQTTINLKQMLCGDEISILGIDQKKINCTIPANSIPGDKITIHKMGMQSGSARGNLIVELKLNRPKLKTDEIDKLKLIL